MLEGEVFNFKFSEDYDWYAYVDQYVPDKSIQFLMTKASKDWENTTIKFEVVSYTRHKYILRFEHEGWGEINDHFRRTSYCWAQYLSNLKKYLATGVVVPFGQRTDF